VVPVDQRYLTGRWGSNVEKRVGRAEGGKKKEKRSKRPHQGNAKIKLKNLISGGGVAQKGVEREGKGETRGKWEKKKKNETLKRSVFNKARFLKTQKGKGGGGSQYSIN